MKFADIRIGTRLVAGFTAVLSLLLMIAGIAYMRLQHVSDTVAMMMNEVMAKERLAAEWSASTNSNGARTMIVAESLDPVLKSRFRKRSRKPASGFPRFRKSWMPSHRAKRKRVCLPKLPDSAKPILRRGMSCSRKGDRCGEGAPADRFDA